MCRYVGILVYQGLIEDVDVFNDKRKAGAWVSKLAEEYGPDNCADSIIWDTVRKDSIAVGIAH
jgi:hypothetical protein